MHKSNNPLTGVSAEDKISANGSPSLSQNLAVLSSEGIAAMINPQEVYAGIYVRLSRDDPNNGSESLSITHQTERLSNHAIKEDWKYGVYVDDGVSGTTFERPGFKRLIADIERGKINLVLTKDLSRLGRNYLMVGYYTEIYFPQHNVRFMTLDDGSTTDGVLSEFAPFMNIVNEWHARDISIKIRKHRDDEAKKGKFLSSVPPYGYMRSPDDNQLLIEDPTTGPIYMRICTSFDSGNSARNIGEILNQEGVLTPCAYFYASTGKEIPSKFRGKKLKWSSATVLQILQNTVYLGTTVNGKRKVRSYKDKRRENVAPEAWIVVEDTHEPLISREMWDRIQKRIQTENKKRNTRVSSLTKEISLFSGGILRCADCGAPMALNNKVYKDVVTPIYRCTTYAGKGKTACTSHSIHLDTLEAAILMDIRQNARLLADDKKAVIERLKKHLGAGHNKEIVSRENQLAQAKKQLAQNNQYTRTLYEDRVNGLVSLDQYGRMMAEYETERVSLTYNISRLQSEIEEMKNDDQNIDDWVSRMEKLLDIDTLDRPTVLSLIDKIKVYEKQEVNGIMTWNIDIAYKFVGRLDLRGGTCS